MRRAVYGVITQPSGSLFPYPATETPAYYTLNPAPGYQIQYIFIDGIRYNAGDPIPPQANNKVITVCWVDICENQTWQWFVNWSGSQLVYTPPSFSCPLGGVYNGAGMCVAG
jgi:hypothetical protein